MTLFVGEIGWITVKSFSMFNRVTGKQTPVCIWESSDGNMLPNTMGHQILEVDVMQGANPKVFRKFNDVLERAQAILKAKDPVLFSPEKYEMFYDKEPRFTKQQAISILSSIRNAAHQLGFRFCKNQLLFSNAILTKKLDCDTSAYLFISIGNLYNFPIKPVLVPGHMFVRFYLDSTHYINLNTNGYLVPKLDGYFVKRFNPSPYEIHQGIYMESMGYRESISGYYAYVGLLGKTRKGQSRRDHLLPFLAKAFQKDPLNPVALDLADAFGYRPPNMQIANNFSLTETKREIK